MVKRIAFLLLFFSLISGVYAEDLFPNRGFRLKERKFELGFNTSAGVFNNLITLNNFTAEKMIIDIDSITALIINADADITPFYFKINDNNDRGFGFSLNVNVIGNMGFPESLISFNAANNEKFDSGFAVFADASIDAFFHKNYFKIKIKPSLYFPVLYSKPDISYTFSAGGQPSLKVDYDARVYTALQIDNIDNINFDFSRISGMPGVDVSFGIEYPLARAIGIYKQFALFDFDVGVDFQNIPIAPSSLVHYLNMKGEMSITGSTIEEFFDSINTDNLFSDVAYGKKQIFITRPFRTNIYANWRPYGNEVFTITPNVGFSVNPLFLKPFSPEGGIKVKMDLANIFVLSLGTNYEDRVWKYKAGIDLNFKIFELNIGAEARTEELFSILKISGAGVIVGIKLGF